MPAERIDGVLSQLPVTLTAGLLVLAATALELGAGLVLARAARRRPFDSFAEALLAAMVAAVLKDTLLLGLLGGFGLFLAPVLLGVESRRDGRRRVRAADRPPRPADRRRSRAARAALGSIGSLTDRRARR